MKAVAAMKIIVMFTIITVMFIVVTAFILLQQETNINHIKSYVKNKYFCSIVMPFQDTKILEFNQYQKSDKAPFIIYANLECTIEKIHECKSNTENSSATKIE